MKNILITTIIALLMLTQMQPAFGASKSFTLTVTIPASVQMHQTHQMQPKKDFVQPQQIAQNPEMFRDGRPVTIRSVVAL